MTSIDQRYAGLEDNERSALVGDNSFVSDVYDPEVVDDAKYDAYAADAYAADPLEEKDPESGAPLLARRPSSFVVPHRVQILFKNIRYTVSVTNRVTGQMQQKVILKDVNGGFLPARFTAIMGQSGAGKTSLMNLVSEHLESSANFERTGDVLINGAKIPRDLMHAISGFVQQEDVIMDTMTVYEAVMMAATLKLPRDLPHAEKDRRTDELLKILHLHHIRDHQIGSVTQKGISGGEKRRVAVAMEMITNPNVLFLDEPTSGLDTFHAFGVAKILRSLATSGRTVVSTIHQPSSEIFELFHDLFLLHNGDVIYAGPAHKALDYFSRLDYHCPKFTNPADFIFMNVLNNNTKGDLLQSIEAMTATESGSGVEAVDPRIDQLVEAWKTSEENKKIDAHLANPQKGGVDPSLLTVKAGFWVQFWLLASRAMKNVFRNPIVIYARFGQVMFLNCLISVIFFQVAKNQQSVQDREGALFFVGATGLLESTLGSLAVFFMEKLVFLREYNAGMYSLPAYFFSRVLVETPFRCLMPIVGSCVSYWAIGFQHDFHKFSVYVLAGILLENAGMILGMLEGCLFPDIASVLLVAPVIVITMILMCGYMVNLDSIPSYFAWAPHASPLKYSFGLLVQNEFNDLTLHCSEDEFVIGADGNKFCPIEKGEQVVESLNFDDQGSITFNMFMLVVWYFLFIGMTMYAMHRNAKAAASSH